MKIAVVTCYHIPDYVRARTLRAALREIPGVKVIVIKNRFKGVLRYPEVLWMLWQVKRKQKPDAYLLTFRGQEILPFVLLLAGKKPVMFDEFIVPIAYATNEQHHPSLSIRLKYFLARVSVPFYNAMLHRCRAILADTQVHAELSARLSRTNLSKYLSVPVGTDETLFKPAARPETQTPFTVFYYSLGMQPLHGVSIVLEAAEKLKDRDDIDFLIVGGKRPLQRAVNIAAAQGAHVRYERWIPFENLVQTIQDSALCLGGPFGDTVQAHHVITGKTYQFLACGAPVLIGAGEATDEYFIDKQNALVVPQGDAEAIAKAVKWAAHHPIELKTIAANGHTLYEKKFSLRAITERLQPLIDTLS